MKHIIYLPTASMELYQQLNKTEKGIYHRRRRLIRLKYADQLAAQAEAIRHEYTMQDALYTATETETEEHTLKAIEINNAIHAASKRQHAAARHLDRWLTRTAKKYGVKDHLS